MKIVQVDICFCFVFFAILPPPMGSKYPLALYTEKKVYMDFGLRGKHCSLRELPPKGYHNSSGLADEPPQQLTGAAHDSKHKISKLLNQGDMGMSSSIELSSIASLSSPFLSQNCRQVSKVDHLESQKRMGKSLNFAQTTVKRPFQAACSRRT